MDEATTYADKILECTFFVYLDIDIPSGNLT